MIINQILLVIRDFENGYCYNETKLILSDMYIKTINSSTNDNDTPPPLPPFQRIHIHEILVKCNDIKLGTTSNILNKITTISAVQVENSIPKGAKYRCRP